MSVDRASFWDDLIGEDAEVKVACQDCRYFGQGTGPEAIRTVLREADEHATEHGHHVKADLDP